MSFSVKNKFVLGHKNLGFGIQVDQVNVEVIAKLTPSISVKGVGNMLGCSKYVRAYEFLTFIKKFSKIEFSSRVFEEVSWSIQGFISCVSFLKKKQSLILMEVVNGNK